MKSIKKVISLIICISMVLTFIPLTFAQGVFDPFVGKNEVVVATIGGSLTAGDGTDYVNDWVSRFVRDYLPTQFPDHTFVKKNAGIGGTSSEFGMYRFATDVAAVNPDLVIVEFAVNDNGMVVNPNNGLYLPEVGKRNMESILQQCLSLPKIPYVMFLCLGTSKNTSKPTAAYTELANYYGIPTIDANGYLHNTLMAEGGELDYCEICKGKTSSERIACGAHSMHHLLKCEKCAENLNNIVKAHTGDNTAIWQTHFAQNQCNACVNQFLNTVSMCNVKKHSLFYNVAKDGTHPDTAGAGLCYYDYMISCINKNPQEYFKKPSDTVQRLYTRNTEVKGFLYPNSIPISKVVGTNCAWKESTTAYQGPTGTKTYAYSSNTVGESLTFKFHGPSLSFFSFRGADLGAIEVTVDNATEIQPKVLTQYYETSLGYGNKTQYQISMGELSDTWHTVNVKNVGYSNDKVTKTLATLAYAVTDSKKLSPDFDTLYADGKALNSAFIPMNTTSLKVSFDGQYDDITDSSLTFTDGTQTPISYVGSYNITDNSYTFNFAQPLAKAGVNYKIVLNGATKFNGSAIGENKVLDLSSGSALSLADFSITDLAGNILTSTNLSGAKATIVATNNANSEKEDVLFVFTQTDKDGKIKNVSSLSKTILSKTTEILSCDMNLSNVAVGDNLRVLIWNGNTLNPYTSKIVFSLDTLKITQIGNDIAIFNPTVVLLSNNLNTVSATKKDEKTINVSGNTTGEVIAIKILNKTGEIVYVDTVVQNGAFSIDCKMNNLKSETYTICIGSK